jgi:ribosomal protein L20
LKENEIEINRKSLAYLAVNEPDSFAELAKDFLLISISFSFKDAMNFQ